MAVKTVIISATAKLVNDIAARVLKTFTLRGVNGIAVDTSDMSGRGAVFTVDLNYLKENLKLESGGGDTYLFKGDDYINVEVK